jgi:tetratricopeptide (TPR) repeat protein
VDFNKVGYEPKKNSAETDEIQKNIVMSIKLKKLEGLVLTEDLLPQADKANILFDAGQVDKAWPFSRRSSRRTRRLTSSTSASATAISRKELTTRPSRPIRRSWTRTRNINAVIAIGSSYMNKKDTDRAIEWYNKIDVALIDDPTVLYNIGTEYFNQLRHQDAFKYYRKAAELQPTGEDSLCQLGLTDLTLGNYKDAVAAFETFLKVSPESERAEQVNGFIDFLKTKI